MIGIIISKEYLVSLIASSIARTVKENKSGLEEAINNTVSIIEKIYGYRLGSDPSVLDLLLSIVHGALSSLAFDGVICYEKYDMPEFAMSGKPMELIVKKYGSLIEEIRTRILGIENNKSYLPFEIIKDVVSIKPSVSNEKYFTPAFDLLTDVVIMSGLASDMNSFEVRSRYFYVLATTESIDKVSSDTFDYEIYCVTGPYTFLINNVFYLIASGKYKYIYLVSNEKHYDKVKDTVPNDLYTRILNVTSEWDEYADRILTNLISKKLLIYEPQFATLRLYAVNRGIDFYYIRTPHHFNKFIRKMGKKNRELLELVKPYNQTDIEDQYVFLKRLKEMDMIQLFTSLDKKYAIVEFAKRTYKKSKLDILDRVTDDKLPTGLLSAISHAYLIDHDFVRDLGTELNLTHKPIVVFNPK
ncbi:hypothetical protein [Fervidobacterium sp. 2310opik-2]|uniref:hypothetical protein n=2 Tax=Fervidobacterium TaxID=2422 RepID=UPI0013E02955|nr:hypothetical protein [Fervidobacterium sp. 2310opik-2]KAF2960855.1 hypothetical protein AS161_03970 [Fervidobacterium sp. 2310opik-2]